MRLPELAADWEMSCMSIHLRLIIGSSIFAVLALLFAAFSYHSQSVSLGFAQNFYDGGIDPLGRLQVAKGKERVAKLTFNVRANSRIYKISKLKLTNLFPPLHDKINLQYMTL